MDRSFGINERLKLFNDRAGFARINAHNQPYERLSAEDYFYLGIAFHQREKYEQAIERYDRAMLLDSQEAMFYNNRGIAKRVVGDRQGAIADFDKVIELNPTHVDAYNSRGAQRAL